MRPEWLAHQRSALSWTTTRPPLLDRCWYALSSRPFLALVLYMCLLPVMELLHILQTRRFLRARSIQPHRTREPDTDTAAVKRFWERIVDDPCVDEIVRGWFVDRECEAGHDKIAQQQPQRGNVLQLVAWTLFDCDAAILAREEHAMAEAILLRLEEARGAPYESGTAAGLECMRHTLGELEPVWKPFGFYVAAALMLRLSERVLEWRGFELRKAPGGLEYWNLPPEVGRGIDTSGGGRNKHGGANAGGAGTVDDGARCERPIVFMHGVGGLPAYTRFLLQLAAAHPSAPLLLPLFPSCTIRLPTLSAPPPLRTPQLVVALEEMVAGTGAAAATFVAHSMGTAYLAATLRARPALARSALFVDPICFLLYRREVLYNFLYRRPTLRRSWWRPSKWFALALHRVLTQEPTMQSCFRRDFWWSQLFLHADELPCASTVLLAGRDAIVPALEVERHLRAVCACEVAAEAPLPSPDPSPRLSPSPPPELVAATAAGRGGAPPLRVEMHEDLGHGMLMLRPHARRGVLEALAALHDGVADHSPESI